MSSPTTHDQIAAGLIAMGLGCLFLRRRLPHHVGSLAFCALTTIGVGVEAWFKLPLQTGLLNPLVFMAAMSLFWSLVGFFFPSRDDRPERDNSISPFFMWSLVCGTAGALICFQLLTFSTWPRIFNEDAYGDGLPSSGLPCLVAIFAATVCWRAAARDRRQPVILLGLAGMFAWWTSLIIPSGVGAYAGGTLLNEWQPAWWTWTLQLQTSLASLLLIATILQDLRFRRRRAAAWPNRLDDLISPYSRWPAYIQTEAVLAAVVLVAGVHQIVRSGPPSWPLQTVSATAALVAGVTCLFLTYRRWSANTAGLGLALFTLFVANCACGVVEGWMHTSDEYAVRIPILFNAVLVALWLMIALWRWLANFWGQQLLDGRPWTTAGRMIPCNHRTAFLLSALSVLIAFRMALWPQSSPTGHEDTAGGRMIVGVVTILLLCLQQTRSGRRERSVATATFAVALGVAAIMFAFVRLPASPLRGWILQYDPVVYSGIALPILAIAESLPKTSWSAFATPLWMIALLFLPTAALVDLLISPLPADWVRPLTLALLGALYSFAAGREHRGAFIILGVVLLIASLLSCYTSYGRVILDWLPH